MTRPEAAGWPLLTFPLAWALVDCAMKGDPINVRQANLKVSLLFGAMTVVLAGGLAASFLAGRAALHAMDRVTQFDAAIERLLDSIRDTISAISSQQVEGRTSAKQAADSAVELRGRVFLAAVIINLGFLVWAYRRIRSEIVRQYVANLETQPQKEILAVTNDGGRLSRANAEKNFRNSDIEDRGRARLPPSRSFR